jgi:hypothetical protein
MSIKARHSASLADGGYPGYGWRPQIEGPPPPEVSAPPPAPVAGGWRTVQAPYVPKRRQAQKQLQQQGYQQPGQHGQQIVLCGSHAPAPAPTYCTRSGDVRRCPQTYNFRLIEHFMQANLLLAPGAPAGHNIPFMSPPPRDGLFSASHLGFFVFPSRRGLLMWCY